MTDDQDLRARCCHHHVHYGDEPCVVGGDHGMRAADIQIAPTRDHPRPATGAGRSLLERTSGAAATFNRVLREAGIDLYDLKDWMPAAEEVIAIEREAAGPSFVERAQARADAEQVKAEKKRKRRAQFRVIE